jgi:Protein of unknown function (DUF2975)
MRSFTVPFGRLSAMARAMEAVTIIGIVLLVILSVRCFLIPDWTRNLLLAKLGHFGASLPVTAPARFAAAAVVAVPVAVMLYGLLAVRTLFREFAEGRVFTERSARCLQVFAASVLAQAPLGPLTSAGLTVAISMVNDPSQRLHAVTLSLHDYYALIVGGVLFVVATIMREAARIADENASIV